MEQTVVEDALEDVENVTAVVEDTLEDVKTVKAVVEDSAKYQDIAEFRKQIGWLEPDASVKKRRVSRCRRLLAVVWKPIKHAVLCACCFPSGVAAVDELGL